jgi:predicted phosphodiesterase
MTRLAVLADIHGNLPALEAVAADLAAQAVDHVVVAGDVISWGPFPAAVVERALREGWSAIRGNGEFYLLDYMTPRMPAAWSDRTQYATLPLLNEQLADWRTRIAAWPDTLSLRLPDAPPLRVVHGSPRSPWEGLTPLAPDDELRAKLAGVEEATVIAGHTHTVMDRSVAEWRILNPGSVGVPLDGCFAASYMLLDGDADGWRPTFRRVPFDYAPLFAEFERQRFIERCGVIGRLIVGEFRTARIQVVPFLRWRAAHRPDAPITPTLLEEFLTCDPWEYISPLFRLEAHRHDWFGQLGEAAPPLPPAFG